MHKAPPKTEGLKQKIQSKSRTLAQWAYNSMETEGTNNERFKLYKERQRESLVSTDSIIVLFDEAIKQIQEMSVATTLEHTHPSLEFWKGWNKAIDRVLAVLDGEQ